MRYIVVHMATNPVGTTSEDLSVTLTVRVSQSMLDQLRAQAALEDRPVGYLVREAVAQMLGAEETS